MRYERIKRAMRWAMAALYAVAGIAHLWHPGTFLLIMPDWVPYPRETILITGICEVVGAIALMTRKFRWMAGLAFALYAVCVFPANIKHAVDNVQIPGLPTNWLYHGPRLLLQPVLVWWALFCAGVIDWPARAREVTPGSKV